MFSALGRLTHTSSPPSPHVWMLPQARLIVALVLFGASPLIFAAAPKAPIDPIVQAKRAYRACAAAYEREATHGADRAFMYCQQARRDVLERAATKIWEQIEASVPAGCKAALVALRAAADTFAQAQQAFSEAAVRPAPGRGEAYKAELDSFAAESNYRYAKALQEAVGSRAEFDLGCGL